jgi:hypothetical protein
VLASGLKGIISLDIAHAKLGFFAKVCDAPMDLATRGADVLVACRDGEVVTLTSNGVEVAPASPGLRRIAVDPQSRVFVANADGEVTELGVSAPIKPADVPFTEEIGLQGPFGDNPRVAHANTPHRLLPLPTGGVAMLFQQSLSGELTLGAATSNGGDYGGSGTSCQVPATRPSVTTSDGSSFTPQYWMPGTHIVDAALSPSGQMLAVADTAGGAVRFQAMAGNPNTFTGDPFTVSDGSSQCQQQDPMSPQSSDGISTGPSVPVAQPTGVGFSGKTVVVLNMQPLELQTIPDGTMLNEGDPIPPSLHISLRARQPSPLIEGQQLFFSNPSSTPEVVNNFPGGDTFVPNPSTLACASGHPDGLSNGATTTLSGLTRRVMPLAGRLRSATLFHWAGGNFHDEVAEGTWHHNMGGAELTASQETSLVAFLRQLPAPVAPSGDAALIAAGRAAFHTGQCDTCHVPDTDYTNDQTADVGRGMHKVPSLIGVVYTAPYMSDGCAKTLEARFTDTACAGANHGAVQNLAPGDVPALIAFLKTL